MGFYHRTTPQAEKETGMKKTNYIETENKLLVDIVGLQALLSCGIITAKGIAEKAGATIHIGRRRLYNVEKIKKYLEKMGAE